MKVIFALALCFITQNLMAQCLVYIPTKSFLYEGYRIHFDFHQLLQSKGYRETADLSTSNFQLALSGKEISGRNFKYARILFALTAVEGRSIKVEESQRCLNQHCSITDFSRAFNKGYKTLGKRLTSCEYFTAF
jgi:hypothetical protein